MNLFDAEAGYPHFGKKKCPQFSAKDHLGPEKKNKLQFHHAEHVPHTLICISFYSSTFVPLFLYIQKSTSYRLV